MRRGKEIAQGAHASGAWLTRRVAKMLKNEEERDVNPVTKDYFTTDELIWMAEHFTKVCLQVDSEQELRDIMAECRRSGINSYLIEDEGVTEFHNVPTVTALAIGPIEAHRVQHITGKLKLY